MDQISYMNCCSKLEKIASKRRIFGSESKLKLNKKNNGSVENDKLTNGMNNKMPFISAGSANKSHHIGVNIQTTMSMIKQFPGQSEDHSSLINTSSNLHLLAEMKSNKNSRTSMSRSSSEIEICPATFEDKRTLLQKNDNPWAVEQSNENSRMFEDEGCHGQHNSCNCPSRGMDSYYKIMAPFIKHLNRKPKLTEALENPYTKEKNVKYYELLSRRIQELKLTMMSKNNDFATLNKRYNKLYDQYVRSRENNLKPILLRIEDELRSLKSQVDEAVEIYKEAVIVHSQERDQRDSSSSLLESVEEEHDQIPRETNTVRLAKVLRRVQFLQDKLKTGHILRGSGDQTT